MILIVCLHVCTLYIFCFKIFNEILSRIFLSHFRDCLKGTTINSENIQINCPFVDEDGVECNETISERELREVRECLHYSI